jgi:hypothetical protein
MLELTPGSTFRSLAEPDTATDFHVDNEPARSGEEFNPPEMAIEQL